MLTRVTVVDLTNIWITSCCSTASFWKSNWYVVLCMNVNHVQQYNIQEDSKYGVASDGLVYEG